MPRLLAGVVIHDFTCDVISTAAKFPSLRICQPLIKGVEARAGAVPFVMPLPEAPVPSTQAGVPVTTYTLMGPPVVTLLTHKLHTALLTLLADVAARRKIR